MINQNQESSKKYALFNPLPKTDFTCTMRDDSNTQHQFTIPAQEIMWFDFVTHRHLKKHLATMVYHEEGNPKRDRDLEMEEIYKRIDPTNELA